MPRRTHWPNDDGLMPVTIADARGILAYSRESNERLQGIYAQDREIQEWAEYNGYVIVGWARDVGVHSLSPSMERPAFSAALAAVEEGKAAGIAVRSLDRLGRDFPVQDDAIRQVWDAGGRFFSCEYGEWLPDVPGSPSWRLRRDYARMAEDQRLELLAKLQKGRREKIARGGYGGGYRIRRRYGVELVQIQGRWEYRPIPAEQAVIRRIVAACEGGRGYSAMARQLNAEAVPTATGAPWRKHTIRTLALRGTDRIVAIPPSLPSVRPFEWAAEATA